MVVSNQDKWNRGENEGPGGPLPTKDGQPLRTVRTVGTGTSEDPYVSRALEGYEEVISVDHGDSQIIWIFRPTFPKPTVELYESFARAQCKYLGFSCIWLRQVYVSNDDDMRTNNIRSTIHDGRTTRCPMTGRKTGYEPNSDQDHITVYLGHSKTWITIHGHLYTVKNKQNTAPVGLLPVKDRWLDDNGRPGRNPELWKWTRVRAERESQKKRQVRESKNWLADREQNQTPKPKQNTNRSMFFSG